jgi:hypothetical protein
MHMDCAPQLDLPTDPDPTRMQVQRTHCVMHMDCAPPQVDLPIDPDPTRMHVQRIHCAMHMDCAPPQVDLPIDPDVPSSEAPCGVSFSSNAGHVAVCWPSGPVAIYEVALPACMYDSSIVDRPADAPPLDLTGGQLILALHFPLRIVTSELGLGLG